MRRLTRDGTAEPVSRDQILRHARGQGNVHFPCSADHEQDWQPYPVDPYSAICDDHTYIHTYIASQEYCTYFLFPPFLVSSAVISSSFVRQSLLFSSPFCGGRCHSQDFSLPVLLQFTVCGTPLPDVDTFRGTGRCRISYLYRYVSTVRTDRRPFPVPTSNPISCCFLSPGARY